MRQASFLVKGDNGAVADISFVSLGAAAGNVLDNVNRWLDQLGQPPITEQKLAEIAQRLRTSLGDVTIVDRCRTSGKRRSGKRRQNHCCDGDHG